MVLMRSPIEEAKGNMGIREGTEGVSDEGRGKRDEETVAEGGEIGFH